MKTTLDAVSQSQKFVPELNIKSLLFCALVMALSASANAQTKTLEQLQAEIASMQACRASIDSPACNLDILDPEIRSLIISVNEGERQLNRSQASQSKANGATRRVGGCYFASITSPSPFMGNDSEVFELSDGSMWEVKYEYEYLYEYYPSVTICPDDGLLIINGKKLNVASLSGGAASSGSEIIESHISGSWGGWQGDTIVKLANGQIWQQVGLALSLAVGLGNEVLVFPKNGGYYMLVEDEDEAVQVVQLK